MRVRNVLALLGAGAILFIAFWFVALSGECGGMGGCIASARVNGTSYAVSNPRTTLIDLEDLAWYAAVERRTDGHSTLEEAAYRLGDVDPARVLVMRLVPGQIDETGALGPFLLLVRDADAWALTCPYFAPDDATRPTVCT